MWKQEQYNKNRDQLGLTEPHHNRPFQSSPIRTPLAENTKKQKRTQKAFNIDLLALLILETMLDLFPSLQVTRQELEKVISEFFMWFFTSRHFPTTSRHFPTTSRHFPTFPVISHQVPAQTSVNYCGPAINCNGLIITQLNLKVNQQTKSGLMQKIRNGLMIRTEKTSSQNREIGRKSRF